MDKLVEQLRKLVESAYNEGFVMGVREYTSYRGGKTWRDNPTSRQELEALFPPSLNTKEGE